MWKRYRQQQQYIEYRYIEYGENTEWGDSRSITRHRALTDLSEIVKEYGSSPVRMRPQPVLQTDVMDEEGNLHAADIGITWENNETFLHGVRVVGPALHDQLV